MREALNNSKILFVASLGFLACSIFGAVFLYGALGGIAQEIGEARGRIAALDSELKNLKIFEKFIADTEKDMERIRESFISRDELLRFIDDVENAGRESEVGVRVESANLSTDGINDSGPSFRLEASGNFSSVFKYSLLLENLPYEISFEEMNITKSGDENEPWRAVYVVKLLSYEF